MTMNNAAYQRLSNSSRWTMDALHDAYLNVGPSNPNLWAKKARQLTIDEHRRQQRQATPVGDLIEDCLANARADTESIFASNSAHVVRIAVQSLPDHLRQVAEMRWLEELTPTEICERLRCNRNTIYTRLRRALNQLRAQPSIRQLNPSADLRRNHDV